MTTTEYTGLCYAHGFPRIDDDPVATDRELRLINLAREHGDSFKLLFNTHYINAWGIPFFKGVKPRITFDEYPETPEYVEVRRRALNSDPSFTFFGNSVSFPDPLGVATHPFPSATMANGQTKNTDTDTMNIQVNITADDKILDAINNLAAAVRGVPPGAVINPAYASAPYGDPSDEGPVGTPPAETPATPAPEPKKKEKKAPVLKAPEPAIEPEPDILANVPTGAELKARVTPLKDTPFLKQLRDYMDGPLGLKGTGLAAVTDVDALKKLEIKVTELLAAKEAADADV